MKLPILRFFIIMKSLRFRGMICSICVAALLASGAGLFAQDDEPITISRSDFFASTEELMKDIERLEGMAATSTATAEYARAYQKLQAQLGKAKPPVVEWTEESRERLKALPEPSDAAWKALELEEQRIQERLRARTDAAREQYEQAAEMRREEERLRLAEKGLALNAAESAARRRELEARAEYYEDPPYIYPSYNNLWWRHHGHHWRPSPHLKWQPGLHKPIRHHNPLKIKPDRAIWR